MSQQIWSDSETEQLIELIKKDIGPTAAGKELGRSADSVRHKMAWLKDKDSSLVAAKIPPAPKEEVKAPEPVVESKPLRKKETKHASYPQIEYCPVCHAPVSDWTAHINRLGWYGCKMPAA